MGGSLHALTCPSVHGLFSSKKKIMAKILNSLLFSESIFTNKYLKLWYFMRLVWYQVIKPTHKHKPQDGIHRLPDDYKPSN